MTIDGLDKIAAFGAQNTDALLKSGTAFFKGIAEMTQATQAAFARSAETADSAFKTLSTCKSPAEFIEAQTSLARDSLAAAIAESCRFAEIGQSAAIAAAAPLTARFAAFQEMVKPSA